MTSSNTSEGAIAPTPGRGNAEGYSGLDKQGLFGWWKDGVDQQNDLYMRLVERSFDMPPKPMGLNAPQAHTQNTANGVTGWQAAAIILSSLLGAGGLGGLGLAGLALLGDKSQVQVQEVEGVQGAAQVELLDQDGNVLELEKWPGQ